MGTLMEVNVTVHAPFEMEDNHDVINMTSSPTKDADRDSVIDMNPLEREHSFIENGKIPNGRVPLTIDTSLEDTEGKLNETPKSSPSDTDSGFEKCLNSPTGSPVSSKSDSASTCSGAASPESVVIVCDSTDGKIKSKSNSSSKNSSPKKGILKNAIITEGFLNMAFDASDEETEVKSRPNSLLAHEMALSVNASDKSAGSQQTLNTATTLDFRARSKKQHKVYWALLAFVVLLIVAAAIVIPILWKTLGKECSPGDGCNPDSSNSSNSTVIPQKARL